MTLEADPQAAPRERMQPMEESFPSSHKIYSEVEHNGFTLQIPKRRIHLTADNGHIDVYDTTGRLVATILRGERKAGTHRAEWSGRDASGARVGAGVYFARFRSPGRTFTEKVLVLR